MNEELIAFIERTYGQYPGAFIWFTVAEAQFPGLSREEFADTFDEVGRRARAHAQELRDYNASREPQP